METQSAHLDYAKRSSHDALEYMRPSTLAFACGNVLIVMVTPQGSFVGLEVDSRRTKIAFG